MSCVIELPHRLRCLVGVLLAIGGLSIPEIAGSHGAVAGAELQGNELFPLFGVSDYESLLVKLAEIGVRPHRDDINKRAFIVCHQLPDDLVVRVESLYRDDCRSVG